MRKCGACAKHVYIQELLDCTKCKEPFHSECVNINKNYFIEKKQDLERKWICPNCRRITQRTRNDDMAPASPLARTMTADHAMSTISETGRINSISSDIQNDAHNNDNQDDNNITHRSKRNMPTEFEKSYSSAEDLSKLADTLQTEDTMNKDMKTELTLHNLKEMINEQLKENNKAILSELQRTIQLKINEAIAKVKKI